MKGRLGGVRLEGRLIGHLSSEETQSNRPLTPIYLKSIDRDMPPISVAIPLQKYSLLPAGSLLYIYTHVYML